MTVYTASLKVPSIATGPSGGATPWVDPWVMNQALNAGVAGVMTHAALQQSLSTGIKV